MFEVTVETIAVGVVGLAALNLATRALAHLYKTFLRPAKNLKKYGKWAVITGATGALPKSWFVRLCVCGCGCGCVIDAINSI
jgi:17beta-estradiol 17-dehydrogenase / very-long-chain 3-oxoacyl-CoA reductase